MKRSKAQLSLEFIVILSVVIGVFALVLLLANQSISGSKAKLYHDQTRGSLEQLVQEAQSVYYSGSGAKRDIAIRLPETISSVSVSSSSITANLLVQGGNVQAIVIPSDINISGSIPSTGGRHVVTVTSTSSGVVFS